MLEGDLGRVFRNLAVPRTPKTFTQETSFSSKASTYSKKEIFEYIFKKGNFFKYIFEKEKCFKYIFEKNIVKYMWKVDTEMLEPFEYIF